MTKKNVYIIAGPNGAGKTTFADQFLTEYINCTHFINADLIAKGLSPYAPEKASIKAGKLVLEQIDKLSAKGADFSFESTLSGKAYASLLRELKENGYRLHLFFLWIPDSKLAIARVKQRVAEGGHNIPQADVVRRFGRSITNFFTIYRSLVDSWMIFDNSNIKPVLIAKETNNKTLVIKAELYEKIWAQVRK